MEKLSELTEYEIGELGDTVVIHFTEKCDLAEYPDFHQERVAIRTNQPIKIQKSLK